MNQLAVFGNPIEHSRSPDIHAAFAAQVDVELTYNRILVPDNEFAPVAQRFFDNGGLGCNVTVPCKGDAWEFVKEAGENANLAEAVNTISLLPGGGFRGDNTDGPGLVTDLRQNLGWSLGDTRILVLGAGGAVRGVLGSLLQEEPSLVHLHNRTHKTALQLVDRFQSCMKPTGQLAAVSKDELEKDYDVIINGTSAGLADQAIDLPPAILGKDSCCYDMVYGAGARAFLGWAEGNGARATSDGLGMLVEQAALAFEIWFNKKVETEAVIRQLRQMETE
ncbi:MAG: shikimate dehydrogenase [Pseudomonadales bacterium]|nr:shikimate dehydrogenase [Pseudomonadales bacterium]